MYWQLKKEPKELKMEEFKGDSINQSKG